MKRKISLVVALMLMTLTVFGCGKREELENTPSSSLSDIINEEQVTDEKLADEECPEGYVYDYQVSMEPIPAEIAALGGDVCGTIHAYPTKIQIALTKQEIENDAELKEQNEKNIEAINKYLSDVYDGEFEIEPMSTGAWKYFCMEESTNKQFTISISGSYIKGHSEEAIGVDTYFYADNAQEYKQELEQAMLENVKNEYCYGTYYESVDYINVLDLYIAVFCENKPDCIAEQKNIIEIYDVMKKIQSENDEQVTLRIVLTYFPKSYKEVIVKQYQSGMKDNFQSIISEKTDKLIENGEVYAQFEYSEISAWDEENNLDDIIEQPELYFGNEYKLSYWR